MKNKLNKLKNKLGVIVFNIMICFCMAENYVFAGGIGKTKLFTGTIQLFKDLRTPLISVATGIAIVMIIINLIRIKISDEMDSKIYTKKIKNIIIALILVVSAVALIPVILSYFK